MFKKAIAKYPNYYEAYYHLGLAQADLGQIDLAANRFQSAINLRGGHYPWVEFACALILTRRGRVAVVSRRAGLRETHDQADRPLPEDL